LLQLVGVLLDDLDLEPAWQAVFDDQRRQYREVENFFTLCLLLAKDGVGHVVGPDDV
jgi:hypothetical protein